MIAVVGTLLAGFVADLVVYIAVHTTVVMLELPAQGD